ncbi:butyrophilin subfamily 3 member A1-like isoform X2 [Lepisosteus oculatus]|uniref:butyrophilin subfamily 3 member A1-like isoform X2 n=1 Tax=Lepisosteus oculatus TaxID=7918 RepID=UPI0037100348
MPVGYFSGFARDGSADHPPPQGPRKGALKTVRRRGSTRLKFDMVDVQVSSVRTASTSNPEDSWLKTNITMENLGAEGETWRGVAIAMIVVCLLLLGAIGVGVWYFLRGRDSKRKKSKETRDVLVFHNSAAHNPKVVFHNSAARDPKVVFHNSAAHDPKDSRVKTIKTGDDQFHNSAAPNLIEWEWRKRMEVEVTLDPGTANCYLGLSEDGREVRWTGIRERLPENPERFDEYPGVLGAMSDVTRGRYWEVEVGDKRSWEVGVARPSVRRLGQLAPSPEEGFWVLSLWDGKKLQALTGSETPLEITPIPRTLGVYLDYEKMEVSFFDAETTACIYTFQEKFSGEVRPFFSPGNSDEEPMRIVPARQA